jgi:hypothetical protein
LILATIHGWGVECRKWNSFSLFFDFGDNAWMGCCWCWLSEVKQ